MAEENARRVVDTWLIPNPPEVAKRWPPELRNAFKMFGQEHLLDGQTVDEVVAEMDAAGVDLAILTGLVEGGFAVPNDVVAEWRDAYPERFAARCCVDPRDPVAACRELERCVRELGFGSL